MTGKEYRTITDVKGPLVFLNKTEPVAFGEIVSLRLSNGTIKNGQVLDTSDDLVIVQVFEGTAKIDRDSGVTFMGDVFKLPVSTDLVGRILDGAGRPRDGGPDIVAEENADIIGAAINLRYRLLYIFSSWTEVADFLCIWSTAQRYCTADCSSSKVDCF
jgi:V/A-type H+-transporting ATPase subunit B